MLEADIAAAETLEQQFHFKKKDKNGTNSVNSW